MKQKIINTILFSLLLFYGFFFMKVIFSSASDGICGSSDGKAFPVAPTTDLCKTGTASDVTGSGPWNWTCVGSDATCTDGDYQPCMTSDNCAGKQICYIGMWRGCVKDDSSCGNNDYCNSQGQWCSGSTGNCVNKCSVCSCPSNAPTCNADGSCSGSDGTCNLNSQIQLSDGSCISNTCNDGTAINQCSSGSVGFQCVGVPAEAPTKLELQPACRTCPCSGNKPRCSETDNTCGGSSNGLPERFSWANKDGVNWLSPIQDQGWCGSCWAFAGVAAVEAMYNIEYGAGNNLNLSEQELLSCNASQYLGCNGGGPDSATNYILSKGIFPESCSPYEGDPDIPCVTTCASGKHGVSSLLSTGVSKDLFTFVYEHGPVPVGINWGTGHAVLMIGWDNAGNILFKNSWGGNNYEWITSFGDITMIGLQPTGTY
ncbi:MAG: C1 family peptidase [Candidatus Moraniibacteriota bacterium]